MEGDVRPEHPLLTLASPQIGNRNKTIAIWAPDTVGIPQLVPGSRVCRAVLGRSAVPDPVRSRSVPIRCGGSSSPPDKTTNSDDEPAHSRSDTWSPYTHTNCLPNANLLSIHTEGG